MALVELDETEVMQLRQLKGVVGKMMSNPTARRKVQEAQKLINPDAVIPEIDAVKPVNDAVDVIRKEMSDFRKEQQEKESKREDEARLSAFRNQWEAGRASVRGRGYTKEGLEALEKFMEDKGIADHEIASAAFEKLNPPEDPIKSSGGRFDVFETISNTNEVMKKLMDSRGEDVQSVGKLVSQALSEVRTGAR